MYLLVRYNVLFFIPEKDLKFNQEIKQKFVAEFRRLYCVKIIPRVVQPLCIEKKTKTTQNWEKKHLSRQKHFLTRNWNTKSFIFFKCPLCWFIKASFLGICHGDPRSQTVTPSITTHTLKSMDHGTFIYKICDLNSRNYKTNNSRNKEAPEVSTLRHDNLHSSFICPFLSLIQRTIVTELIKRRRLKRSFG